MFALSPVMFSPQKWSLQAIFHPYFGPYAFRMGKQAFLSIDFGILVHQKFVEDFSFEHVLHPSSEGIMTRRQNKNAPVFLSVFFQISGDVFFLLGGS